MSDHDPFLAAIRAEPDDDLPRLVYADFLDETGDPDRAALIRVQIELAKLPGDSPERGPLAERERALLAANEGRWQIPLAALADKHPSQIEFRRGFVDELELRNAVWSGTEWRAPGLPEFLNSPLVAPTRLTISSNDGDKLTPHLVRDLFARPGLGHLRHLHLSELVVSPEAVEEIVTRANLARLHTLFFWACSVHTPTARALADTFALPGVRTLGLTHAHLPDDCVAALVAAPRLANLTELWLSGNSFTDVGARALAGSPHLTRLALLNATDCHNLTAAGKAALRARFGDAVRV